MKLSALHRNWTMIVFGFILMSMPLTAAAAPARIAILPFSIHADKDYAFLQQGIVEMLSSRLAASEKAVIVDPALTSQALTTSQDKNGTRVARRVGAELKADYAVSGSITVLGESVSIDAVTVDISGSRPPLTFYKQTRDLGGVIPQIDQMAEEINTRLLGLAPRESSAADFSRTALPSPPPAAPAPPVDIHMHPDKLLQNSPLAAPPAVTPTPQTAAHPLNPAFEAAPGVQSQNTAAFWKSRNYDFMINGIDVGDVDHDGSMETVVAAPGKILIYRFAQGRQQTVADLDTGRFTRNISVSVGDINGNGTPEIFVTALNLPLNAAESSVFEYDGHAYQRLVEKSHYYYSVVHHPTLGSLLLGQRQGSSSSTPFDEPIFQMTWKGADYIPDRQVLPGRRANVLGLAYGDITNSGDDVIVAYNPLDHLRVLLPTGKVEWQDDETYGGTVLYFALPPEAPGAGDTPFYLPVRLRCMDLDKNGRYEVLAFRNSGSTGRLLGTQRYFKHSRIEALQWDGLGLTPLWKTRDIAGRVQDFTVADFDNDGADELLVAVVSKDGAVIFTDARSSLIAFDLKRP